LSFDLTAIEQVWPATALATDILKHLISDTITVLITPLEASVGHGTDVQSLMLPNDPLVKEAGEDDLTIDLEFVMGQEEGLLVVGGAEGFWVGKDGQKPSEKVEGRHPEVRHIEDRDDAFLYILGEVDRVALLSGKHRDEAVVVEADVADLVRGRS
jgi:hypothetical protein